MVSDRDQDWPWTAGVPDVADQVYEQYVWSPRYVGAPVFRDRDADGNPNTGDLGAEIPRRDLDHTDKDWGVEKPGEKPKPKGMAVLPLNAAEEGKLAVEDDELRPVHVQAVEVQAADTPLGETLLEGLDPPEVIRERDRGIRLDVADQDAGIVLADPRDEVDRLP